jgi:hypothetical protein
VKRIKSEPRNSDIKQSLKFLGCNNEDELNDVIELNWYKVKCFKCGKIISLEACDFEDGEVPICRGGCDG